MAKDNIKGLVVEIGGNTSPLQEALKDVNKTSNKLQTELREVNKLLKLDPKNINLLAQRQKLLADSVDNTGDKLKKLKEAERQVQQQFKQGKVSEEQYRALQREVIKTEQELKGLENQGKKTNAVLSKDDAVKNLKNIGKAALTAGLAAGAAFVGMGIAVVNNADELQKQADITGLSAERLQELTYIGNNLGVEIDTITGAQAKLTKAMSAAKGGTGKQADAFKALGIAVTDSNGNLRDAKVVMEEAFTKLNGVGNETERDALAMQMFGKSAMELNPLIKAGGIELGRLTDEANKNGSVMSNEAVAGLDLFGDTLDNIKTSVLGSFGEKFAELMPSIQDFIGGLSEIPVWLEKNKWWLEIVGILLATLTTAIIAFNVAAAWGAITTGVLTAATAAFGAVLAFVTSPITLVILGIGALIAIGVLLYKNWDKVKAISANVWNAISKIIGAAIDKIKEVISGVINFVRDNWKQILLFIANPIAGAIALLYKLNPKFKEWIDGLLVKFKELPTKIVEIGKNLVKGLWDGIVSMGTWIGEKISGFFGGIVDKAKEIFQINSPSVVFQGIGSNIGAGLGNGINKSVNKIQLPTKTTGASKLTYNHTGTIKVQGVNDQGQLVGAVDIIMERLRKESRR